MEFIEKERGLGKELSEFLEKCEELIPWGIDGKELELGSLFGVGLKGLGIEGTFNVIPETPNLWFWFEK